MTNLIAEKLMQSAEKNVAVAKDMYKLGHYNWCLFMWHLALEKMIKVIMASENKEIPYVHDLWRLSKAAGVDYGDSEFSQLELDEISSYNLEVRYEDYKFEFYKKATKEYADVWVPVCKKVYKFLRAKIKNG